MVVDQLIFLTFLQRFNRQAQLFMDLIVGTAVEIGHASVNIQYRIHRTQEILPGGLFVIHKGFGQLPLISFRAGHLNPGSIPDFVETINPRFNG